MRLSFLPLLIASTALAAETTGHGGSTNANNPVVDAGAALKAAAKNGYDTLEKLNNALKGWALEDKATLAAEVHKWDDTTLFTQTGLRQARVFATCAGENLAVGSMAILDGLPFMGLFTITPVQAAMPVETQIEWEKAKQLLPKDVVSEFIGVHLLGVGGGYLSVPVAKAWELFTQAVLKRQIDPNKELSVKACAQSCWVTTNALKRRYANMDTECRLSTTQLMVLNEEGKARSLKKARAAAAAAKPGRAPTRPAAATHHR